MSRAVIRDDGKRYSSLTQAAYALLRDMGMPQSLRVARGMVSSISAACRREKRNGAYGHEWRYADEPTVAELAEKVEELRREVEVLKCRMESR